MSGMQLPPLAVSPQDLNADFSVSGKKFSQKSFPACEAQTGKRFSALLSGAVNRGDKNTMLRLCSGFDLKGQAETK